jgi:preprotein translocase subunit SecY
MFNMFPGALSRFTIFALGICRTSASIITADDGDQPELEQLRKEGETTPQDLHTRYGTVVWRFQAAISIALSRRPTWCSSRASVPHHHGDHAGHRHHVPDVAGEQIAERGLGNGISIIIFAGIAAGCRMRSPAR